MVNILSPTLLHWKSNIILHHNVHDKKVDIKYSAHDAFWGLHPSQVRSTSKDRKSIYFKVLGAIE